MEILGFDPFDPSDASIFSTIRWDLGPDGQDFQIELPVPDGSYWLNLYFMECCCEARHFKIELEGEIVADDVDFRAYDIVDPEFALTTRVGKLSYEVDVEDGVLKPRIPSLSGMSRGDPTPTRSSRRSSSSPPRSAITTVSI